MKQIILNPIVMNETQIRNGSSLIAKFLGWEKFPNSDNWKMPNLFPIYNINDDENTGWIEDDIVNSYFHTDWAWIMHVVEKITITKIGDGKTQTEYTYPRTFGMIDEDGKSMCRFYTFPVFKSDIFIEAVYLAVVDFLEWYYSNAT